MSYEIITTNSAEYIECLMIEEYMEESGLCVCVMFFFFSSRRRHTSFDCDWSSDVCSSDLPDLPTADEAGLKGFEVGAWHGIYAPKGTPDEIIQKLAKTLQEALRDPDLVKDRKSVV